MTWTSIFVLFYYYDYGQNHTMTQTHTHTHIFSLEEQYQHHLTSFKHVIAKFALENKHLEVVLVHSTNLERNGGQEYYTYTDTNMK